MGLLDRLLRGRRTSPPGASRELTGPEVVARWRYLLATAPPEVLATAHGEGLAGLGGETRGEVLHRLRAALSALEPGAVVPSDEGVLVRAASRAERRAPGFLERALSADARGTTALTGLAAAVVAAPAAAPFLRTFEPGLVGDALADRRAPDFDHHDDSGHEMPGGGHDDELDGED
ncbi:MAG TPA: hypothetical protein VMH40_06990 [Myxococcaceae bacterium]|nr:hypothetical protein [Myxococcaceae bacterium]